MNEAKRKITSRLKENVSLCRRGAEKRGLKKEPITPPPTTQPNTKNIDPPTAPAMQTSLTLSYMKM